MVIINEIVNLPAEITFKIPKLSNYKGEDSKITLIIINGGDAAQIDFNTRINGGDAYGNQRYIRYRGGNAAQDDFDASTRIVLHHKVTSNKYKINVIKLEVTSDAIILTLNLKELLPRGEYILNFVQNNEIVYVTNMRIGAITHEQKIKYVNSIKKIQYEQ